MTGDGLPSLLAALQLASPALPVGGFAYSQGLERAIDDGTVRDARSAQRWICDVLALSLARVDAPMWLRAYDAPDPSSLAAINAETLALRETAELRAECEQMGASMLRLFAPLGLGSPPFADGRAVAFPAAFAAACARMQVGRREGLAAWLWSWAENQVLVAVKSVPLGQQEGQAMLLTLREAIAEAVGVAESIGDDEIGSAVLGFALASARHETQYSRLYRS